MVPAPVAANDTATLQANKRVMIAVLANDTRSDGTLEQASIKIVVAPTHGTFDQAFGVASGSFRASAALL
jgi:cadherin-like protein